MRLTCTFILFSFAFVLFAQEENSLLWEISGNGLEKTSYLYGTMHVSKKIAFRLDDVFYQALDESEKIALESDPGTWLENDIETDGQGTAGKNGFVARGFYSRPFNMKHPGKEDLAAYLSFEDRLINNILYRTDESDQNFEEETYLDMFIYQAGTKFGKPIIALEDLEESTALVGRASLNAIKQKPDEWLQKKMQRQDLMYLMQDAYRQRNINLLDSIDRAMYTDHYLENMLYIRNENMAQRLDSAIRTAKVFAGIGAAHLPGQQGVINRLRKMGYIVTPLTSPATAGGNRLKATFENTRKDNRYIPRSPDDGFFSIGLPAPLYPVSESINTTYLSPDLTNGSYFMVNRIPVFSYLKKKDPYSLDDIDGLLFENIPGKIVAKTRIRKNGFEGLDIKNLLKNGDHQRYQIFCTPLEILIFKMGGDGDYVAVHSDTIFNSIKFRDLPEQMVRLSSGFRDFEITMPSLYQFSNRFRNGNRNLEGYDPVSGSYYFLRKSTLNDFNFIEADTFELKQIQKRFYQDLKLHPEYDAFLDNTLTSRATSASATGQDLYLKTVVRRGEYYLLGILTFDEKEAGRFFSSFKLRPVHYSEDFRKVRDTALFFTTVSPVKPPKFVDNSRGYYRGGQQPRPYAPYTKKTVYQNRNDEAITVEMTKSHDYLTLPGIDSVWALRKKQYAKKNFGIQSEYTGTSPDGYHELQLTLTDTASTRGILIKNVLKGGVLYELKALVDTAEQPSRFVSEFFGNFKPSDTLIGRDVLADKTADFFSDLRTNDSIVLSGYRFLSFDERHIDSLIYYISGFDFPKDKKHIQSYMIQKLGGMDNPRVLAFFREYYDQSYNNSEAQIRILQSVARERDERSIALLLELMSRDLPLVSNNSDIRNLFDQYRDTLQLAKKLFPELLDYSGIPEYKPHICSLLAQLKSRELVRPRSYKKYRKQLLADANSQLKRLFGLSSSSARQGRFSKAANAQVAILEDYAVLLFPFIQEKEIAQFFRRIQLINEPGLRTAYAILLIKNNRSLPSGMLDSLASDINSRAKLFNGLEEIGKSNLFPRNPATQQKLAEAALFDRDRFDPGQDQISFMEQRKLSYAEKHYTGYYFKLRNHQEYDKNYKMHLVVYEEDSRLRTKPAYKNDGMRIEDTDSDAEAMDYVTEEFYLRDRKRAMVYRPDHPWDALNF